MPDTETMPVPPATAIKQGLEALQGEIGKVQAQLSKQQEVLVLLADVRDTIKEALEVTHNMTKDLLDRMIEVEHQMKQRPSVAETAPWWHDIRGWGWHGAVVGSLVGAIWVYTLWTSPPFRPLALGLDRVLVQSYSSLPKAVQEQVSTVYGQVHLEGPGKRQGRKP
jgi:hypothetical protein